MGYQPVGPVQECEIFETLRQIRLAGIAEKQGKKFEVWRMEINIFQAHITAERT